MITSLLVAVDSSPYGRSAQEQAVVFGRAYRARVTGLYVLDVRYVEMPPYIDYSYTFEAVSPILVPLDAMESFKAKSERILAGLRDFVGEAGLQVDTRSEEGVPGQIIADVGRTHDLVIMGKRGEHAKWGKGFLGSTAESVARRSATPVLLVESTFRPLAKALVMFDGSHPANRALKLAADLAAHTGLSLDVLTVGDDVDAARGVQGEALAYLEPLDLEVRYYILPGRATKTATALLAERPADVMIMGTHGHSALYDLILGSTAEQVMRSVELPVLLVP